MPATTDNPQTLLASLTKAIQKHPKLLTAFSGGVDSTLVAVAARRALGKQNAPAAIGDSPSLPRHELQEARNLAKWADLELIEVAPAEQADPGYQANQGNRCYFCKTHLYSTLRPLAKSLGITAIANGTNTDDLGDHRPGLTAASENNVVSPLLDAGLGKKQVRALALALSLPNADKPAAACLSSRLAYGLPVTLQRLHQVEQAETLLRNLGFTGIRVRHHDTLARLEIPLDQFPRIMDPQTRDTIAQSLKQLGFTYITLDIEGFRSGSGNLVLPSITKSRPAQ
jgi:pyridinium-3,5-biscarboxylic acid mononucleotide sulfurtransferase